MAHVDGFLIAVPTAEREAYRELAAMAAPIFREHGALSVVECWGDDVPEGKVTSFPMAVKPNPARPWCSPGSSGRRARRATRAMRRSWPTPACSPRRDAL